MTTPNEELMARAKRLRNELDDSNSRLDRQCVTAMYEMEQALQSQAERIKELEAENGKLSDLWSAMKAKRDELREKYTDTYWELDDAARENTSLRAQLTEIAATEPVATLVVEWVFHEYDNSAKEDRVGHVSTSFHRTAAAEKMPLGKYALFTRPMPAQDVTELVEAENKLLSCIQENTEEENRKIRAQLAAIAANEPVAYRWVWKSKPHDIEGWCYTHTPPNHPELQEIEKLFTHPMPAQGVAELVEAAYDKVQRLIVDRYHVEKSIGGFWPCCVKAGDGTMDIFVGSKKQAERVRQALQTACLDGAFMMSNAALYKYKGAK